MKPLKLILLVLIISLKPFSYAQNNAIPVNTLSQYFSDLKAICEKDNGKIWGKNLWSPIIVIDRKTRFFIANENDSSNALKPENNLFTGYFPENLIIANSTTSFAGKYWTMVGYPLPEKQIDREILFIHEMFHRLQKDLWKGNFSFNIKHMDNKQARILMKLEWNALLKAVNSNKSEQKNAISNALVFNYYRKQLYSGSDTMENKFELLEGLAEYTAMKMCLPVKKEIIKRINDKKTYYWNVDSYTRSFGYYSGLLYAFLLDFTNADWRNQINAQSNLQALLQKHLKINLPENILKEYETSKSHFGFDTIDAFEEQRELKIQKTIADYKERLLVKSHLTLKLANMNVGFNPSNLISIDTLGTIYPNIQIIDNWGKLIVDKGGCLLDNSWKSATINAENIQINENTITGNGWVLKLNENWKKISDRQNYLLKNEK